MDDPTRDGATAARPIGSRRRLLRVVPGVLAGLVVAGGLAACGGDGNGEGNEEGDEEEEDD